MTGKRQPTARDIRALVAFLPKLYGDDSPPAVKWATGEKAASAFATAGGGP